MQVFKTNEEILSVLTLQDAQNMLLSGRGKAVKQ